MKDGMEPTASAAHLFGRVCYSCGSGARCPNPCPGPHSVPCFGCLDRHRSASDPRLACAHVCLSLPDLRIRVRNLVLDGPIQSSLVEQRGWLEVPQVPSMSPANESYPHKKTECQNMIGNPHISCRLLAQLFPMTISSRTMQDGAGSRPV